jgi:GNAT superfamily N-acetyltransferase
LPIVFEIAGAAAPVDDVRTIQRRRDLDEATVRLSLLAAERGSAWVARDEGEVVAIAVAHDSDDERYLGDCFVEPSYRGHGIGARLLEAAFHDIGDRDRAMSLAADDAAAVALAFRFGMVPREQIVRFAGAIPREEELAKMAAGEYRFQVDAIDPLTHAFGLNELDRQRRGTARPADHAAFAGASSGNAFFLGGELVGYAYVWPDGGVGPLACASEAYLVQIFAYTLVTLQRVYGASWCSALVPGLNRRIAKASLRAGLRITESFLLAAHALQGDMSSYVAYHRLLL